MSQVYRALEKAEREKREKTTEGPSLKVFKEKEIPKKEEAIIRFPEEKVEKLRLPREEVLPVLTALPDSYGAEQFRNLKTKIFLRMPNPPHTILVTSAVPQEGKTTVAVNLALAISNEINRKAILIDGDLRKPSIYLDDHNNSKGLSDYLSDQTPLAEILLNAKRENLRIIQAGRPSRKSTELIGSKKMKDLINDLRGCGDDTYIVIDSPPVISASESAVLSKMVDGIIFVMMGGQTPKESIKRAIQSIDQQRIIGVVFNQKGMRLSNDYSKYYYKYYKK